MTLVELLVAISIMLIVFAGVAAGASSGLRLARGNTNRIVAANVADRQISDVRAMEFADIPQGTVSGTVSQGAVTYTWTREAEMVFADAEESCETPSGAFNAGRLSFLRVVVEITWPRMEGIAPVRSETLIEPPVADYDPYRGHLAVKVTDRDDAPVSGMTVYLRNADASTPSTNTFDTTDSDGCVFFDSLPVISGQTVGNYHVWLNRSGWVDRASGLTDTSTQSPRPVVNVVSAQLRKVEFAYDRTARLDVNLAGRFGGTAATGLPVTIANDNYNNGNGPVVFGTVSALAGTALHPFTSGFSVWAGDCPAADLGGADRTRLATDPDVTASGTVLMGTTEVTVRRQPTTGPSSPVSGATIVAEPVGCTSRQPSYTVSGATTDTGGQVTIALPYGQWRLRVDGRNRAWFTSWPTVTLSPTDGTPPSVVVAVR